MCSLAARAVFCILVAVCDSGRFYTQCLGVVSTTLLPPCRQTPRPTPPLADAHFPQSPNIWLPPLDLGLCTCCPFILELPPPGQSVLASWASGPMWSCAPFQSCVHTSSSSEFPRPWGRPCPLRPWHLRSSSPAVPPTSCPALHPTTEPPRPALPARGWWPAVSERCCGCLCPGTNFLHSPLSAVMFQECVFLEFCQILQQRVSFNSKKNSTMKEVQRWPGRGGGAAAVQHWSCPWGSPIPPFPAHPLPPTALPADTDSNTAARASPPPTRGCSIPPGKQHSANNNTQGDCSQPELGGAGSDCQWARASFEGDESVTKPDLVTVHNSKNTKTH